MNVRIVGSGTLLPDDRHRSAGHLVQWTGGSALLDCGSGVVHGLARDGVRWAAITHVLISHFHTDHIGDLPALLWAWTHGTDELRARTLVGPPGMKAVLAALADAHGDYIWRPGGELAVVELGSEESPGGDWSDADADLVVRATRVPHTAESLAYRVETAEGSVGYTGDSGPSRALGRFFRGVDVLISECSVPDGSRVPIHLSPADVAALAAQARPATLVLTHLYPSVERAGLEALVSAAGYDGIVHVATDGLLVELGLS